MRPIPALIVDAELLFDNIAAAKQQPRRDRMVAARPHVLNSYQTYDDAVPEVGTLAKAPLTGQQKEAMRHAFSIETQPMTSLRGELLKRISVARCPFCSINESSTLDHYLPKEQYAEFSIFPNNLVPSCPQCNTLKRDRILVDGTNVRMFLHPCYDDIPASEFLRVRIRLENNALILSYRLSRPAGVSTATFEHLKAHFTQLNLADRYRRMGLEHLGGQYAALRRAYGTSQDAERVAEKLNEVAGDFEVTFGPNYWTAKLYRAVAANDEFCDGGFEVVRFQ